MFRRMFCCLFLSLLVLLAFSAAAAESTPKTIGAQKGDAAGTGFSGTTARADASALPSLGERDASITDGVLDSALESVAPAKTSVVATPGSQLAMAAPSLRKDSVAYAVLPTYSAALNGVSTMVDLGLDGAGMKVAVLDTGVDATHPDLGAQLLDEQCFCSGSNEEGCCPNGGPTQSGRGAAKDDNGHGTNVAGIIVGRGNIAPRGGTPNAGLIAIKVADRNNRFCCSTDLVSALNWLLEHHPDVDVVNLSLGTDPLFGGDCDLKTPFTRELSVAVNALVAKGATVAVSAGNHGNSGAMSAPACLRNSLSVGATWAAHGGMATHLGCTESATAPRQAACFSNRSTTTDVYAAGAFVVSTGLGGGTSRFGGTSQAAPMVAACAVALKQAAPTTSVEQRMDAIRQSGATVRDDVSGRSYPFLDCMAAVKRLNPELVAARMGGERGPDPLLASAPAVDELLDAPGAGFDAGR